MGYPGVIHAGGYNIACYGSFSTLFDIKRIDVYKISGLSYGLTSSSEIVDRAID